MFEYGPKRLSYRKIEPNIETEKDQQIVNMFKDKNISREPMSDELRHCFNCLYAINIQFQDLRDVLKPVTSETRIRIWIHLNDDNIRDTIEYYSITKTKKYV